MGSEEEIFGKTNKRGVTVGGYPKLMFHALAIMGNTAIWFSVLAIMVSYYGNMKQKQAVAGVYLCWIMGAGAIQYTHPWNDDPVSMLDMPMPLLLGSIETTVNVDGAYMHQVTCSETSASRWTRRGLT